MKRFAFVMLACAASLPNASAQKEHSFNKSEVSPESIAEAFVQAYSGSDVDAVAGLYADRVDHTNSGVISNAAVRAQAKEYFARWPVRHWSLIGQVKTIPLGPSRQKVIFSANYDVENMQTNKHASGVATETLILASENGAMKIVSQKEQTSKRNASQGNQQRSEDSDSDVAKASKRDASQLNEQRSEDLDSDVTEPESGQQTGVACKLVAQGDDKYVLNGHVQCHIQSGGEILEGNTGLPWAAALGPNGKLLWAAKMQIIQPVGSASGYGLTTDGDYLWLAVVLNNGAFRLARFKAGTLEREASVQTELPVTQQGSVRIGPWFQFYPQTGGDLQVSVHRTFPDSVKVVVFSRELRAILDKTYSIPDRLAGKESEPLSGTSLIRLPDRTGYYLVMEPQVFQGKRAPRIGIIRLDNTGAIKWANVYTTGPCDNRETRVADDGAILVSVEAGSQESPRSTLIKIGPDGTVNWATAVEGIYISFQNFSYYDPSSQSAPYRFTQPSLLAIGGQPDAFNQPSWMVKWYAVLFKLNYETGGIEKQIKFGANSPGRCTLMEHDANSFYVGFGNEQSLDKPSAHGGSHARPNVVNYHGAVLRFDYDLNLLAAEKVREAASANLPILHLLEPDRVLISYDGYQGTVIVETTNANLESSNTCRWLDKETFTFTKPNFQQHQVDVAVSPLTSITVSDGNSKIAQSDLSLVPLDLKMVPCKDKADQSNTRVVSARLAGEHLVSNGGARMIQGDVQLTFSDGRIEVITHDGKCRPPEISKNGAVFWMHCTGLNERGYIVDETCILRNPQGKLIDLKGEEKFLRNSAFSADGNALVTMWGGYHGPSSFIKFDANSGNVLARVRGVFDYNKLPSWAKPLAKGDMTFENAE